MRVLLVICLLSPILSYSQDSDSVLYRYSYKVTIRNPYSGKVSNDSLIVEEGKNYSVCYSHWDRQFSEKFVKFMKANESNFTKSHTISIPAEFTSGKLGMSQSIYKVFTEHKIIVKDQIGSDIYIYEDSLNSFNWQLTSDTAFLNGYSCQKAETLYRGRQYVAWFTKEISLSTGPLKFGGLPGLVIRINDSENQFSYELASFGKAEKGTLAIRINFVGIQKVDRKKFTELKKALYENPLAFINGQGGSIKLNTPPPLSTRKYNPLELE